VAISFRTGGLITAVIGIVSFPWQLYEDAGAYIFTWLVGYGSLLATFLAVMVVDLLAPAARAAGGRRALPLRTGRPLLVLEWLQRARADRRSGGRHPGAAGLHRRGDDRGRDHRRPELLR
jgi:hypothetical protein